MRPGTPGRSGPACPPGEIQVNAVPMMADGRTLGFVVLVHDLSFVERREAHDPALPARRLRRPRARRRRRDGRRRAAVVARLEQRDPPVPARRHGAPGVPADPARRPRAGGAHRRGEGVRSGGRGLDAAAAQADAEPPPARREGRHRRQPRALHPRADDGRRDRGPASRERPRHRARAGDARLLGRLGRARQRLGGPRDAPTAHGRDRAFRPARSRTCCAACGSRPRKSRATTTASPTRGSGRSATSPHARPIFRSEDWEHYQAVNQKFADAVCDEVDSDDPIVLVQDYHFALAPRAHPRAPAARDHHHLLAHPLAERRALRHLPVARRAAGRDARQQHPRLPHPAPLQQLPRLRRPLPRGAHRPRAERGRPAGTAARWCGRTRSRSSGRSAGLEDAPAVGRVPGAASARSSACRRTRCSASASTASTTRRASRSGCWPSSACSSGSRATRAASPSCSWRRPAARASSATGSSTRRVERLAARINERFGDGRLPPDRPAARAPRAARPCSGTTAPPTSAT